MIRKLYHCQASTKRQIIEKKFCLVDYERKAEIPVHVHRSILENNILKFLLILRAVRNELATKI